MLGVQAPKPSAPSQPKPQQRRRPRRPVPMPMVMASSSELGSPCPKLRCARRVSSQGLSWVCLGGVLNSGFYSGF